jgi:hypothetical protein
MKPRSVLIIVLFSVSGAVQAQSPPPPPAPTPEQQQARAAVRQACATDLQSLCSDKKGREAMMCLRSNQDKVSAGCKEALSKLPRPGGPAQ